MLRAIIYVRQSLASDDLAVDRQEEECRKLCTARDYDVSEVICDNNRSATSGKRPGFDRLTRLIEAKELDVVVVLRHDRLLRRLTELEHIIELSEKTGVLIATVQGDLDLTNSTGRLLGRILASVARAEVETKSERHRLANTQKARAGLPHGSRRAYGYEADLMTVYEPEATVLRQMASKVIAGQSYKAVAYWLNEHDHTTTTGKPWYAITVKNMLGKPRYRGIREHNGVEYQAAWQPIFDDEIAARLQLTMKLRAAPSDVPVARKYLLTGLLVCGSCGLPLNGATKRDHPGRPLRRTYHCRVTGDTKRDRGCGGVVRNADALEHWLAECVLYRLDTPELGSLLSGSGTHTKEMEKLVESHSTRTKIVQDLVDDYATGLLNRQQFARAKAVAEAALKDAEAALSRLQREAVSLDVPAGRTLREAYMAADNEWKRKLLDLVIAKVVVNPGITKPWYEVEGKRMRFDSSLVDITWAV